MLVDMLYCKLATSRHAGSQDGIWLSDAGTARVTLLSPCPLLSVEVFRSPHSLLGSSLTTSHSPLQDTEFRIYRSPSSPITHHGRAVVVIRTGQPVGCRPGVTTSSAQDLRRVVVVGTLLASAGMLTRGRARDERANTTSRTSGHVK